MTTLVFDTESDYLIQKATKLWCVCLKELPGDPFGLPGGKIDSRVPLGAPVRPCERFCDDTQYNPTGSVKEGLKRLSGASTIIGHNIIQFDIPLLEKLYGWKPNPKTRIIDTLVLSRLLNPDRDGGHSLGKWGERLGRSKPEHEDWGSLSHEMLHRCSEDVEINTILFERLWREYNSFAGWAEALELEQEVARIIGEQERRGIKFDVDLAHKLLSELDSLIRVLNDELMCELPDRVLPGSTITDPFRRDGQLAERVRRHYEDVDPSIFGGPFCKLSFEPFNLNSQTQVKEYLLANGWKPTRFTEKGSPQLTEDSFYSIRGPFGDFYKKRSLYTHRRNQIQGWLDRTREDGRLAASANTIGTNTCRFRHINVVNVPKASPDVFFGKEMRSLFTASPGRKLVGYDADGLELRMLAHYMGDEDFIDALVKGDKEKGTDVHTLNQRKAALPTRDNAKTFIYALIYGAGDKKLGAIVQKNKTVGKQLRERFLQSYPRLGELIERVQREAEEKGFITGLDGRKIWMRRDKGSGKVMTHKALNTLIQSAGAIVMKRCMVLLDQEIRRLEADAWKVLDMHDEAQLDVLENDVEFLDYPIREAMEQSGEYYKLNLPLKADVKVGNNWSETH